jgi:predicted DNA-binding transcriptional regulator YafY
VRSVVATDRPVERPDGFDLAATWEATLARIDARRTPYRVVGLADPSVVGILRAAFGTRLTVGEPGAGGRLAIELRGHSLENLAAHLAGFAESVEIVEPEEVRAALAAIGDALVATYAR